MRIAIFALLATIAALPAAPPPAAAQPSPPAATAAPPTATVPTTVAPTTPATPTPRASRRRGTAQQRFDAANTSHDGKLTLDQAKAGNMTRVVNNFDAIDTTRKGYVTVDDIRTFGRAQRAARHHPAPQ